MYPRIALLLLMSVLGAPLALAGGKDIRYVTSTANLRAAPNGTVVGSASPGTAVVVNDEQDGWANVETDRRSALWVSSRLLCAGAGCWHADSGYQRNATALTPKQSRPYSLPRQSLAPSPGACPCSGSGNCIGPRGGRYCITSGGNKRYR